MKLIDETGLKVAILATESDTLAPMATILIKGTFKLVPDGICTALPPDKQRKPSGNVIHMDDLGRTPSWVSDYAPFKPHTDCFVLGQAHAPGGVPLPGFQAGFRVGPLQKTVQVWGPRQWRREGLMTAPQPVGSVPLRWELCSGGMSNLDNLYGRGQEPDETGIVQMPQIENPSDPVRSPKDHKRPYNLAPVPASFPERQAKAGTRDRRWLLFRSPLPPRDYDPTIHNAAPADQQAGNYPRGTEAITLFNLHPTVPELRTAMPGLRPRAVLRRENGLAEEVPVNLDTIILVPDEDQLVLLWRGRTTAADAQLSDIATLLVQVEPVAAPPAKAKALFDNLPLPPPPPPPRPPPAAAPSQTEAELAKMEADALKEVRSILKKATLPPEVRAAVESETDPAKLLEILSGHMEAELKRLEL